MATSAFAQQQFITIATGGTAGTYYPLGGALADIWNKNISKMNATAQATGASIANINLLKGGNVDVISHRTMSQAILTTVRNCLKIKLIRIYAAWLVYITRQFSSLLWNPAALRPLAI